MHPPPNGSEEVENTRWAGETYLPLLVDENSGFELVREVLSIFEIFPGHEWNQVLGATPLETKAQILAALLDLLPRPWQQELAATK